MLHPQPAKGFPTHRRHTACSQCSLTNTGRVAYQVSNWGQARLLKSPPNTPTAAVLKVFPLLYIPNRIHNFLEQGDSIDKNGRILIETLTKHNHTDEKIKEVYARYLVRTVDLDKSRRHVQKTFTGG
jgi:hypothetical protein